MTTTVPEPTDDAGNTISAGTAVQYLDSPGIDVGIVLEITDDPDGYCLRIVWDDLSEDEFHPSQVGVVGTPT